MPSCMPHFVPPLSVPAAQHARSVLQALARSEIVSDVNLSLAPAASESQLVSSGLACSEGMNLPAESAVDIEGTMVKPPLSETLEELQEYQRFSRKVACKKLGIGVSSFKQMCRRLGLKRWEHRALCALKKSAGVKAAHPCGVPARFMHQPDPLDK
jgi:hypothetical protein